MRLLLSGLVMAAFSLAMSMPNDEKTVFCYGEGTIDGKPAVVFSDLPVIPTRFKEDDIKSRFRLAVAEKSKDFIPNSETNWVIYFANSDYDELSTFREEKRTGWRNSGNEYIYVYFSHKLDDLWDQ